MEYRSLCVDVGLGVERVAVAIGVLGREKFEVEEERLVEYLCRQYERLYEADVLRKARASIEYSIKMKVVIREYRDGKNFIKLVVVE